MIFVTILDCIDTLQAGVKERLQIVFVFAGCNGIDDLIAIQIGKEFRSLESIISDTVFGTREKNAIKGRKVASSVEPQNHSEPLIGGRDRDPTTFDFGPLDHVCSSALARSWSMLEMAGPEVARLRWKAGNKKPASRRAQQILPPRSCTVGVISLSADKGDSMPSPHIKLPTIGSSRRAVLLNSRPGLLVRKGSFDICLQWFRPAQVPARDQRRAGA